MHQWISCSPPNVVVVFILMNRVRGRPLVPILATAAALPSLLLFLVDSSEPGLVEPAVAQVSHVVPQPGQVVLAHAGEVVLAGLVKLLAEFLRREEDSSQCSNSS